MFKITIDSQKHGLVWLTKETIEDVNEYVSKIENSHHWGEPGTYSLLIEDISSQVEQERINAESRRYLGETDWLAIRFAETGISIPQEIAEARQTARAAVVELP